MGRALPRRIGLTVLLAGSICRVSGQDQITPATYESFFRQVSQLKETAGPMLVNGQPTNLMLPSAQAVLGLTDAEAATLNAVATDCRTKTDAFTASIKALVFDLRLLSIGSEPPVASVTQRLRALEQQRTQLVSDHVRQLRSAFGDSRFQLVDDFINLRTREQAFFPAVPIDPSRPVPRTTSRKR